ncbi:hypothetical protein [Caballeronia sp. DA-9]|uniref:hypothetical protein n=1 Tax=Caballeronia sp. DA-9 TaxID=3436237 RepID=UPI003F6685AE
MTELLTILGLLTDNIGWVLINIAVPVILPPAGLLLARLMPLQQAERERTRIVTTIQDGQLGWLALAWSAATIYEAWEYMEAKGHVFAWVAVLLASEIVVVLTAMFIAAGGAVTADTSTNRSTRLSGSIIVATMSAMLFIATHLKTLR